MSRWIPDSSSLKLFVCLGKKTSSSRWKGQNNKSVEPRLILLWSEKHSKSEGRAGNTAVSECDQLVQISFDQQNNDGEHFQVTVLENSLTIMSSGKSTTMACIFNTFCLSFSGSYGQEAEKPLSSRNLVIRLPKKEVRSTSLTFLIG